MQEHEAPRALAVVAVDGGFIRQSDAWITLDRIMKRSPSHQKIVAALQTACICIAVEAVIILLLGTFMNSYWGAAGVSFLILGPVSWWLAPPVYGRLLRSSM